jgi:hypothetical protein
VIEILDVTPKAKKSIEGVPVWEKFINSGPATGTAKGQDQHTDISTAMAQGRDSTVRVPVFPVPVPVAPVAVPATATATATATAPVAPVSTSAPATDRELKPSEN